MNWLLFFVLAWVFMGLEVGFKDALVVGTVSPSFVFVLLAFIAMAAPKHVVFWCAVALGIAMDLLLRKPLASGVGAVIIVGPHVLAYGVACQLILSMRGLMMRRNPFTLGFLAFVGSLVSSLVLFGVFALRHVAGSPIDWHARQQLVVGVGSALYTGVIAIGLALVLFPLAGPLGLPDPKNRWSGGRR